MGLGSGIRRRGT